MEDVKLPPVLVYTVLRLLAFLVPFGILMLFPAFHDMPWLAAVFAALIGLSVSVLFLRRSLGRVSEQIQQRRRTRTSRTDEEVEDAEADAGSAHEGPEQEDAVRH